MADGRGRAEWSHTSAVLCMLANCHRDPKRSRPFKPQQFNPYTQPRRRGTPVSVERLSHEMMSIAKRKGRRR